MYKIFTTLFAFLSFCLVGEKTSWSVPWELLIYTAAHEDYQINSEYFRYVLFCKTLLLSFSLTHLVTIMGGTWVINIQGVGKSMSTVAHMGKDMQVMVFTMVLSTKKNVTVAQCT